jgi:signal transduction histidine kinase
MVAEKPAAEELLARLKEESQEAVVDVRRLVYGLRPPALDDLGLVAAIRQQAAKHGYVAGGGPIQIGGANRDGRMAFIVEAADDLPPLPAAVEVATYRIAQEAMANAARHAEARSCRVCLSVDEAARTFEVRITDDGVGIPEDHRAGVGMSSMRERAEELGGTLTVERLQEGGTCVLARLPLPAEEE